MKIIWVHDHYEEIDNDELNYMSCWFNDSQLKKVTELMNLIESTNKPIDRECHQFEDGEINDFFEILSYGMGQLYSRYTI